MSDEQKENLKESEYLTLKKTKLKEKSIQI